jgi:hypothetical protein
MDYTSVLFFASTVNLLLRRLKNASPEQIKILKQDPEFEAGFSKEIVFQLLELAQPIADRIRAEQNSN